MTLRNLGQIAGLLKQSVEANFAAHEDVDVFYAPSECHIDVERSWRKECHALVNDIEHSTGYTAEELMVEFRTRVKLRWLHINDVLEPLRIVISERKDLESARQMKKYRNRSKLPGGCDDH